MIVGFIRELVQHYNEKSYWKMRQYVQNSPRGGGKTTLLCFSSKADGCLRQRIYRHITEWNIGSF